MKTMKRLVGLLLTGILTMGLISGCGTGEEKGTDGSKDLPKIGIIQYIEHPSLDTIRENIISGLKEAGYEDGKNCEIDYKNAQGDQNIANSIVQAFAGDEKDVVVAIASPVAQAAATISNQLPVVFSAVTDPVAAKLVTAMDVTDKNITGTSDVVQVDKILDLAKEFVPDMKKLGFLYSTGESNSVSNLEKAKEYCEANGITLVETGISNSSEVQQAVQVLASKVDAIFIPNDNTIASAMQSVSSETIKAGVPVFTGADSMVGDGGLATNGIQYEDLGKETAKMVAEILKGTKVSDLPVKVFDQDLSIFVNENTAKALDIIIPDSIKNSEKYVVKNSND